MTTTANPPYAGTRLDPIIRSIGPLAIGRALTLLLLLAATMVVTLPAEPSEAAESPSPTEGPCGTRPCAPVPPDQGPCGDRPCAEISQAEGPCGPEACPTRPPKEGPCGAQACSAPAEGQGPCGAAPCKPLPPIEDSCGSESCAPSGHTATLDSAVQPDPPKTAAESGRTASGQAAAASTAELPTSTRASSAAGPGRRAALASERTEAGGSVVNAGVLGLLGAVAAIAVVILFRLRRRRVGAVASS